ncbi:unnamed protein product [Tetraodon nigroviridis]|uniref:(spotted green pufferfish) hypothetical protein n=1 Tax=Tetraodon nigroviridis TaxID=99883 RepID=Q4T9E5_TETNG|nr:unnamed protein product [Tetraodon nigroviridis]
MERSGSIQLDIPDFSNSVLSHLNQLRVQGRLCDIVVNVQGQSFRAHKVVLAASSPYFRDHMSLSQMSTVSLTVIRNPGVFEQLLGFCYTGRLRLQLADIISYLTAASFLQMQHIIDRCTQILEGIHLKISLADLDQDPGTGSRGNRTLEAVVRAGAHHGGLRLLGGPAGAISPAEEPLSPALTAEPGGVDGPAGAGTNRAAKEPLLRIDRAGQWYVETSGEPERPGSAEEGGALHQVRIKTERVEDWIGGGEQPPEGGATVVIDTSGRSALLPRRWAPKAGRARSRRPASARATGEGGGGGAPPLIGGLGFDLGLCGRFSPTGSVVVVTERQRAKSESPNQADDPRQPSSQVPRTPRLRVGALGPPVLTVRLVSPGGGARRVRHGRLRRLPEGAGGRPLVPLQPPAHLHLLLQVLQPEGQPGPPHAPAHGNHALRLPHLWQEVHPQGPAGVPHPQAHGQQALPLPRLRQELPLPGHPQPALPQEPPRLHPPRGPQRLPRDHHRLRHVPRRTGRRGLAVPGGAGGRGRDRQRRGPVRRGPPGLRVHHGARLRGAGPAAAGFSALTHVYLHSQTDQKHHTLLRPPTPRGPRSLPVTFRSMFLYLPVLQVLLLSASKTIPFTFASRQSGARHTDLEHLRAPTALAAKEISAVRVLFQCDQRVPIGRRSEPKVAVLNAISVRVHFTLQTGCSRLSHPGK